jgi:thiol-disulfide isomerase/thioredoxin
MGTFRFLAPAAVAAFVCLQPAHAQVSDQARQLLTESTQALQKAETMSFHARRYATGPVQAILNTEGNVKLIRHGSDRAKATIRMTGKTPEPGRGTTKDFDVFVSDGIVTWVDPAQKKVFERQVTARGDGSSELSVGNQLVWENLLDADPYRDQLLNKTDGFKVTVEGKEAVGKDMCDVVKAVYNNGQREVIIHIGPDKLPHKIEKRAPLPPGTGNGTPLSMIVEMTDIKVNEGLKASDLALGTPEGFTRDVQVAAGPDPKAPQPPAEPVAAIGIAPGTTAPAFNLKNTKGETVTLDSMKNNVVVLSFWGTWNGTWKKAAPTVEKIAQSFSGKPVKMVGMAVREKDPAAAASRWTEDKMTFPTVVVPDSDNLLELYKVKGCPAFVIIGGDGKVVDFVQGFPGEEQFAARMTASINRAVEAIKK